MLSHKTLGGYYKDVFVMSRHSQMSLTELEEMVPYEKYLYLDMLVMEIEKQKERAQQ